MYYVCIMYAMYYVPIHTLKWFGMKLETAFDFKKYFLFVNNTLLCYGSNHMVLSNNFIKFVTFNCQREVMEFVSKPCQITFCAL